MHKTSIRTCKSVSNEKSFSLKLELYLRHEPKFASATKIKREEIEVEHMTCRYVRVNQWIMKIKFSFYVSILFLSQWKILINFDSDISKVSAVKFLFSSRFYMRWTNERILIVLTTTHLFVVDKILEFKFIFRTVK